MFTWSFGAPRTTVAGVGAAVVLGSALLSSTAGAPRLPEPPELAFRMVERG